MTKDIERLITEIRNRHEELTEKERKTYEMHLESLARFHMEPMDYPEVNEIDFPESIHVAYAVCHPECGTKEFIVEGGTQECQKCGGLMFRQETKEYKLKTKNIKA